MFHTTGATQGGRLVECFTLGKFGLGKLGGQETSPNMYPDVFAGYSSSDTFAGPLLELGASEDDAPGDDLGSVVTATSVSDGGTTTLILGPLGWDDAEALPVTMGDTGSPPVSWTVGVNCLSM